MLSQREISGILKSEIVVRIGADNRCLCTCADRCPLGRSGSMDRCRLDELDAANIKTVAENALLECDAIEDAEVLDDRED